MNGTTNLSEGLSRQELAVMPYEAAAFAHVIEYCAAQTLHRLVRMHPDAFYQQAVPASPKVVRQSQPAAEKVQPVPAVQLPVEDAPSSIPASVVEEQVAANPAWQPDVVAPQAEPAMVDQARLAIEHAYGGQDVQRGMQ